MTNSAKYGALSDSRGRVEIETALDAHGRLAIDWSENGGPPVKPPTRRGFGSTVIERSIPYDLKGEARSTTRRRRARVVRHPGGLRPRRPGRRRSGAEAARRPHDRRATCRRTC